MNLARRTLINLIAIGVVSTALIVYALAQLLTGALLSDSYPLTVQVPNTGGLIPQQEVTLSGVPIGLVDSFELEGEHVNVRMSIDEGRRIPKAVDVVILRRSAVGEQAIDFRPHEGVGEDFFVAGDVIQPGEIVTPVEVQRLLSLADKVFSPIDPENAGKLVAELADIVRGRSGDIRSIISDSAEFSADVADNGEDYDTLFREGRKVTRTLAANRQSLSRSLGDMADAAALLSEMRGDFEGLLADAPPLLSDVTTLATRANPNLSCIISDFAAINEYVAADRQMNNIEQALRVNQWFFVGFDIAAPKDHAGRVWNRLQFIPPQEPPARSYLPEKRPIPDILPGGACESPFGPGAGSATQTGYSKRVPDARVVRPPNDRRQSVRVLGPTIGSGSRTGDADGTSSGGGGGGGSAPGSDPGAGAGAGSGAVAPPATTVAPESSLPLTGLAAGTLLLIGLAFVAAGVPAARARLRPSADPDEQREEEA